MSKTVVGLFEEQSEAKRVVDELTKNGFDRNEITVSRDADLSNAQSILTRASIPDQDIRFYSEGVQGGDSLVTVETADNKARKAADIMSKFKMVDLDTRADSYVKGGKKDMGLSTLDEDGQVLQVVEEDLQVGKRQVQSGGVRIHTHVTERPVEEQVTLRNETVSVERRPVDREASAADLDAFKEGTIEMTETHEEAVVSKRARVIEEVVIGKTAEDRTETIRDTVRRTDVDVEQLGTETTGRANVDATRRADADVDVTRTSDERAVGTSDFGTYESDYRNYYNSNLKNSGYEYDQYSPVFRYGHALGTSDRYRGQDWSKVEPEARREWESRNKGTWDEFKDSIKYAWQNATGKR